MTLMQLQKMAMTLPVAERLQLAEAIWHSVDGDVGTPPLSKELRALLDQRLAAYHASPEDVVPWEEVKAQLDELL